MHDNDMNENVQRLKNEIYEQIHHSYLMQYVSFPELDEEKLFVLYKMLKETKTSPDQIDKYVVAIMLVQMALDIHDTVSLSSYSDEQFEKRHQLTVLAGDYFSSLYFDLLTNIETPDMIRLIAQSVEEINESKMHLYVSKDMSMEKEFAHLRVIETSFLQRIAHFFDMPIWQSFLSDYFFLKRLLWEKKNCLHGKTTDKNDRIVSVLDSYIEHVKTAVEQQFLRHTVFEKLLGKQFWSSLFETGTFKQKIAKEG